MKLFSVDSSYLPWEFHKKIRPWFQPYIYASFFSFLKILKIDNPFVWVKIVRILSVLFLFYSMRLLYQRYRKGFDKDEFVSKLFAYLCFFLWFLYYFGTRTSSETFSTILFLIAFEFFMRESRNNIMPIGVGILFGLTFLIRFHFAVSIFSLCLWSLLFKKKSIWDLSLITTACFFVMLGGAWLDYLGYGTFEFTLWNFYKENIVNGVAAQFGTSPWWRYFYEVQKEFNPVIGISVIVSFVYFWCRYWRSEITWVTLSFFMFHSMISHKELRFIFPLVVFCPYVLCVFWRDVIKNDSYKKTMGYTLVAVNSFYLLMTIFRPAHFGIDFYKFLYENSRINTIHYTGAVRPNRLLSDLNVKFYQLDSRQYIQESSLEEALSRNKTPFYFHSRSGKDYLYLQKSSYCRELYPMVNIFERYAHYKNKIHRFDVYSLFECFKS